MKWLDGLANVAAIITGLVAAWAYGSYRLTLHRRKKKLEKVLCWRGRIVKTTILSPFSN